MLIAGIGLAMAVLIFADTADARADFEKWSNRSARVLEPGDYNTNGTCSEAICSWKGVQGVGNMGIGDGNISLMKPDVLNSQVMEHTQAMNASGSSGNATGDTAGEAAPEGNGTTKNQMTSPGNIPGSIVHAPASNTPGNGTLVSQDPGPAQPEPVTEAEEDAPLTESLYPDYDLAASVIPRYAPYSITINKPFEHILAEDPCEAAALYGKLIGFTMPSGQVVDVGIKSIGYEY
jgi:hypothetical protein